MIKDINNRVRQNLYRSGKEIIDKKSESKNWCNTWFLTENTKSMKSCSATLGSNLKMSPNKIVNPPNCKFRMQVIEDRGLPVHFGIMVSNPMRPNGCVYGDPDCIVIANQRYDSSSTIYKI